jgi:hypothetical protein
MDAKAKCEKEGMRLAVLNGSKELENVVDYLTYVGKQMISISMSYQTANYTNILKSYLKIQNTKNLTDIENLVVQS